jgi:hypothetical protein
MTTTTVLKVDERPCRQCGATLPAEPSSPGRPRAFCNSRCRRTWHSKQEREAEQRARDEERERRKYESDIRFHGKREADRRARERTRNRKDNDG